jgi:hypothetical protein
VRDRQTGVTSGGGGDEGGEGEGWQPVSRAVLCQYRDRSLTAIFLSMPFYFRNFEIGIFCLLGFRGNFLVLLSP